MSMLAIILYETQLDQLPLFVIPLRVGNSCVEGTEVKCVNVIAGGECMYSNRSFVETIP